MSEFALEARASPLAPLPRCTVVQLSGVAPLRPIDVNAVEAVRRTAFIARGIAYPIYAPLLLPDGAAARMLRQQPGIAEAIGQFNRVTKAVITVGAWGPGLSTVYDVLGERERQRYRRQGGCAEIAGHLLDAQGRIVAPQLSKRIIAVGVLRNGMRPGSAWRPRLTRSWCSDGLRPTGSGPRWQRCRRCPAACTRVSGSWALVLIAEVPDESGLGRVPRGAGRRACYRRKHPACSGMFTLSPVHPIPQPRPVRALAIQRRIVASLGSPGH